MLKTTLPIFFLLIAATGLAQVGNRLQPGKIYNAGDVIKSPRYGMKGSIPAGWRGVLPRDTEVFMMLPDNPEWGEMYVMINENDNAAAMKTRWEKGFALDENITLVPDGEVKQRGDVLYTDIKLAGSKVNTANTGYLEGRCNPQGGCVMTLLITNAAKRDAAKAAVLDFMDHITFTTPSTESPYVDFDWKEFLNGKILVAFGYTDQMNRENYVDLCADGTFTSRINSKGILRADLKGYKGKKTGTWKVSGPGEQTTLILTFKDLPVVEIGMRINDEKIFVNGERYFAGESTRCQK